MISLSAIILIPIFIVIYIISLCLVLIIISYIKQKPQVKQSTFDIAALHLAWSTVISGSLACICFCCSLIVPQAPNWLILSVEIPTYVSFIHLTSAWTIANVVAYGFMMHFDHIVLVTDINMKKFCVSISILLVSLTMTLDYFLPQYNTVIYYLFGCDTDIDR